MMKKDSAIAILFACIHLIAGSFSSIQRTKLYIYPKITVLFSLYRHIFHNILEFYGCVHIKIDY